jgi:type III secretion protein C
VNPVVNGMRPLSASAGSKQPVKVESPSTASSATTSEQPSSRKAVASHRGPSIQADPRINAIIVQDTPDRIPVYERLIAQLDVPTPLIEIEALIIDVNTQRLEELGIAWNAALGGRAAIGYGDVNAPVDANTLSLAAATKGAGVTPATTVVANAANYFIARLRLLEEKGDARIQARPSILTIDNVGALIDLSETFYIRTSGERVATVTPVTAGTTLRVTPRLVTAGDQLVVRLVVDIEDGQIQSRVVDALPTVRRSAVSTQAVVRKDESLLLGGYNAQQNIASTSKVPFLGDLPGVGALFSSKSEDVQRRERLFLIRPKIVGIPAADGTMDYGSTRSTPPLVDTVPNDKKPS